MSKNNNDVSLVPLVNFDSDTEIVRFNDEMILRRIDGAELQRLKKSFPPFQSFLLRALHNVKYVLEMKAEIIVEGKSIPIFDINIPNVRETILSFRLLKTGDVTASCAFLLKQNQVAGLSESSSSFFPYSKNPYYLKKEEIPELKRIWEKVKNVKIEKPHLQFPLFRFNKTFEGKDTNAIVEHIITFESLVFHEEKKSIEPAGNVIGIAIGMLIGKNEQERAIIKKKLIKACKIRNALVHGNLEKIKKYQNDFKISIEIEDYLRRALRKLVEEDVIEETAKKQENKPRN